LLALLALLMIAIILAVAARVAGSALLRLLSAMDLLLAVVSCMAAAFVILAKAWRATRPEPADPPEWLVREVAELASRAGLATPRVRVIRDRGSNAHVRVLRGRHRISVTRGLLDRCAALEREGVLGHELGHIKAPQSRYTLPVVAVCSGCAVALIVLYSPPVHALSGWWLLPAVALAVGAWIAWAPVQRRRELEADQLGAEITGVDAQVAALKSIAREHPTAERSVPIGWLLRLIALYPTVDERLAAVQALDVLDATARPPVRSERNR
jgi:Zn-dependent protease with chaperone function